MTTIRSIDVAAFEFDDAVSARIMAFLQLRCTRNEGFEQGNVMCFCDREPGGRWRRQCYVRVFDFDASPSLF